MAGTTAKKRTENLFVQVLIPANAMRIAFCLDLVSRPNYDRREHFESSTGRNAGPKSEYSRRSRGRLVM
jgi:hypothetical protein